MSGRARHSPKGPMKFNLASHARRSGRYLITPDYSVRDRVPRVRIFVIPVLSPVLSSGNHSSAPVREERKCIVSSFNRGFCLARW